MAAEALHPSSNGMCNYLDTLPEPEGPASLPGSDWEDQLIQEDFNPADLRATREANDSGAVSWVNAADNPYGGLVGDTVWHMAARHRDERWCRFLRSRGLVDMINDRDSYGATPLMYAVSDDDDPGYLCEQTARWMLANGADPTAMDDEQRTVFTRSFAFMSDAFVKGLADKVPPEHITLPDLHGKSPLRVMVETFQRIELVKWLIVEMGAPVRPQDFPSLPGYLPALLETWAEEELSSHRTFTALVLGCGVYGSHEQNAPPAQRSQLPKLRGDGEKGERMRKRIALCLGVRTSSVEIGRLRRAAVIWRELIASREG